MEPTLYSSDIVLVTKFDYWFNGPQRGEVALCRLPDHSESETYLKRVAAVPGDLEPRDAGDDSSLTLEDAASQDSADGTDDKYNYNAESCLPLPLEEPEQVSLLRISGRAEAELTDPECIAAVFELLCCVEPTQQPDAPASYTLAYESEDGSGTLELWSLDGELLCSDGAGAAYEAAGSEAELLELIG
jgi:hypothetical protein